uniref:Uncharacterized protein n=1 Tax=viral metagenome TaxID=1070528 RepID=A0A6M3J9I7_9ZZZZ
MRTAQEVLDRLGKVEDDAHASGDEGIMLLAVRKDTAAALAGADGDYQPLVADATGKLHVTSSGTTTTTPNASEVHLGEVGGNGIEITVTPTLTVGATYVSGDFVGTSSTGMTFANAARVSGGTGRITRANLHDYVVASVAAELWLFSVTPAGLPADSAAFTLTDNLTCIGVIPFNTYYASALNSISNGEIPNGGIPYKCATTSLFGALVTRGAPAYTNGLVSVTIFCDRD